MNDAENRYRFECECNGEIPMGTAPPMAQLKRALEDYCKDSGRSPAKAPAELAAELMLSESSDPLHIYGPDFVKEFDQTTLKGKTNGA